MVIVPFGDEALLVILGDTIDVELNARAHALAARVTASAETGGASWGVPVVGSASVLVPYDPARSSAAEATVALGALVARADAGIRREPVPGMGPVRPVVDIPVRYGGDDGPDLDLVAERTGLSPAQVVEVHASIEYRVLLLGFLPGFAYLGILPDLITLPRRDEPRPRVPRGSVAIAGRQTAVYPSETPGGWHILGRTDASLWDVTRTPPARLAPGDRVRFIASDGP